MLAEIGRLESDYVKAHHANLLMGLKPSAAGLCVHYPESFRDHNLRLLPVRIPAEKSGQIDGEQGSDRRRIVASGKWIPIITKQRRSKSLTEPVGFPGCHLIDSPGDLKNGIRPLQDRSTHDVMRQSDVTRSTISEMINASKSVESDYYRSVILNKALGKRGLSTASYQREPEPAKDINSYHNKTEVIGNLRKTTWRRNRSGRHRSQLLHQFGSLHYPGARRPDLKKRT